MEGKGSSIGLYIAIIALLIGVGNIFFGVLPAQETKGKLDVIENKVANAEKNAGKAIQRLDEWKSKRGMRVAPAPAPMPAPMPSPGAPPLPAK
jgi:hypothetical protein